MRNHFLKYTLHPPPKFQSNLRVCLAQLQAASILKNSFAPNFSSQTPRPRNSRSVKNVDLAPNSTNFKEHLKRYPPTLVLWGWWKLPTFAIGYTYPLVFFFFPSSPSRVPPPPAAASSDRLPWGAVAANHHSVRVAGDPPGMSNSVPPPPPPPFSSSNQPRRNPRVGLHHPASAGGGVAGHGGLGVAGLDGLGAAAIGDADFARFDRDPNFMPIIPQRYK